MVATKIISIDAHGGDFGPDVTVPAALNVLRRHPDLKLIIVGLIDPLHSLLSKKGRMLRIVGKFKHRRKS